MKDVLSKLRRMDWILSACMVLLIVMGVVFINSAGSIRPSDADGSLRYNFFSFCSGGFCGALSLPAAFSG